jgi:flavodoxin
MKKIIIYYSFDGDTKYFAEELAKELNADILFLEPKKEIASKGFSKYIWGGRQAVMKKKPELKEYDFKCGDYDTIIFGAPVWAGSFAPPLLSFFNNEDIVNKKVGFFYCHRGGPGKTQRNFMEILNKNEIIGSVDLVTKKADRESNKEKLFKWAELFEK